MMVRRPRVDEFDNTLILMEYYRDEAELPEGEYDPDEMSQSVRRAMTSADYCWFNLYDGSRAVGLVSGYVVQLPWSKKLTAHIQFLYVIPSHRNITNARMLVDEFTAWATNTGCVRITTGDIGINVERTRSFYQQVGFKDQGCWLTKELEQ